jgi:hypothetical protein
MHSCARMASPEIIFCLSTCSAARTRSSAVLSASCALATSAWACCSSCSKSRRITSSASRSCRTCSTAGVCKAQQRRWGALRICHDAPHLVALPVDVILHLAEPLLLHVQLALCRKLILDRVLHQLLRLGPGCLHPVARERTSWA